MNIHWVWVHMCSFSVLASSRDTLQFNFFPLNIVYINGLNQCVCNSVENLIFDQVFQPEPKSIIHNSRMRALWLMYRVRYSSKNFVCYLTQQQAYKNPGDIFLQCERQIGFSRATECFVYLLVCVTQRVNAVPSHEFIFWLAVRKTRQQAICQKHWRENLGKHFHLLIASMTSSYFFFNHSFLLPNFLFFVLYLAEL